MHFGLSPMRLMLEVCPLAAMGTDVNTVLVFTCTACGVLLLLMSLMISAYLHRDCKARNAPTAMWTILGMIPLVNVVAACVYVFSEGTSNYSMCEKHQQPLIPGQDKCMTCFQEDMMSEQRALLQKMQVEQDEASLAAETEPGPADQVPVVNAPSAMGDRRATAPIATAPSTVISLQQLGGVRHGTTTNLTTRNPFGQRIRNMIGRDPNCNLPIADDDNVSQQHCTIGEDENEDFYLADLDSLNGTVVMRDGQETVVQSGRHLIQDGDILRVGRTEFRVIITRPPEAKKPSAV